MGIFKESLGLNFGTEYVGDIKIWLDDDYFVKKLWKELREIFIYDMFIDNSDRTYNKPNMGLDQSGVPIIWDHEISFAFSFLIFAPVQDIQISANGHVLYKSIKGGPFTSDYFIEKFSLIDENFWNEFEDVMPEQWIKGNDNYFKIKNFLYHRINNINDFRNEILRVLA